jgi:methylase of polypeptide subunit release factors
MAASSRTLRALGASALAEHSQILETEGNGVFQPTATTAALIQVAKPLIANSNCDLLDLGCGWGIIGLELKSQAPNQIALYMSDASETAVAAAIYNADQLNFEADARKGSVFEPWGDTTFDLIVSDISGVSNQVPIIDSWFDGIPCDTGPDGLDLVRQVIINARYHVKNENSIIIMPIISLSNVKKAEKLMFENYRSVEKILRRSWSWEIIDPSHVEKMQYLMENEHVLFSKNGNTFEFYTEVYKLSLPNK